MFTPSLAARRTQQHQQRMSRQNSQTKDLPPDGRNFENNNNINNNTTRSAPASEYSVPYRTSYASSEPGRSFSNSSQNNEYNNNSFRNVNYQDRSPTSSEYSYRTIPGSRNTMYDATSSRSSSIYDSQLPTRSSIHDQPRASIYDQPSTRSSLYEQILPRSSILDQNNRSSFYEHNSNRNPFFEQNSAPSRSSLGSEYNYSSARNSGHSARLSGFENRSTSLDGSGYDVGYSRPYIDSNLSDYDSLRRPRRTFGLMERSRPVLGRANSVFRTQSSRPIVELKEPQTSNGESERHRRKSLQEPTSPLPPRRLLMEIRRHDTAPVGEVASNPNKNSSNIENTTGEEAQHNTSTEENEDRSGQTPLAERIRNLQGAGMADDEISESALLQRALSLDESEDSSLADRIRARSFFSRFNTRRRR